MPLDIYKASAGSGKTFQIVREYLKMAFKRPGAYRTILAVTFTNKATAEMKDRILRELSSLVSGGSSPHLVYLAKELHLTDEEVRRAAGNILRLILHDYSRFSISTIDSLFQRIIRAFSREMHLNPSYRTEIDHKEILEEAVNQLYLEIDTNEELKNWMLNYTEENLRDGKKWNLTEELIFRGAELFKEDYKQFNSALLDKLQDKNFLSDYSKRLKEIIGHYEKTLKEFGQQGVQLMNRFGLSVDHFKHGKASFANHFQKLANGNYELPKSRVLDACNNCSGWYKASDNAELIKRITGVYEGGLNELLVSSVHFMQEEDVNANSARIILANLFSFGLLTDIASKVREISREKNIILLNDASSILKRVINGNDSPFVYEKMGSVYRHYMLDEFQDTSNMQWFNLKPLVENALAEGTKNMVVGDVKQSIYRWRNGDWNLLASQLGKDFAKFEVNQIPLTTNWRSARKIIDFNNLIFRESAMYLSKDFETALANSGCQPEYMTGIIEQLYAEHYQAFSGKASKEGYVRIKFIEKETDQNRKNYRQEVLQDLITQIELVQDSGVRPGDIAILVRSKSEGALVANALMERKISNPEGRYCYDFISNDTLVIGRSPVVKFMLNLFSILVNPDNDIVKADLVYSYAHVLLPQTQLENESFHDTLDIHKGIPEKFMFWTGESQIGANEELLSLPLFNLATRIIEEFELGKIQGELIYLDAFLDLILRYSREQAGGIAHFLDWWELTGKDKTICLSEGQDALTIVTIHKSKGLEFHTVFIPFCDWETVPCFNKVPYLWCHPEKEPFNQLDLVLVKYGSLLERSIFAADYYREMLYSMVDNLNLLYVAFTRAINSLYITCPYDSKSNESTKVVGNLIQRTIENPPLLDSIDLEKYSDLSPYWNSELKIFEFGHLQKLLYADKQQLDKKELVEFRVSDQKEKLKLRIHNQGYIEINHDKKAERIIYGRLLHELFENIATVSDIHRSVKTMVSEGKIDTRTAQEYEQIVIDLLSKEPFKSWFSKKEWRILNERNILRGNDGSHRPDRIMLKDKQVILVDYKTGDKHESHLLQVKRYMRDFKKMGFDEIKGYLWYLSGNELIEVLEEL